MARFEAKTHHGIERRLEEADLEQLFHQGKIQLDTPCRRMGSPNWFRLDELFPDFKHTARGVAYRATLATGGFRSQVQSAALTVVIFLVLGMLVVMAIRQISRTIRPDAPPPATQSQP